MQVLTFRQGGGGDQEHVRAVLGEDLAVRGSGEDAGEIEHAHASERAVTVTARLRIALGQLHYLHGNRSTQGDPLRMLAPFLFAARDGADHAGVRERVLELEGIPP
jgi:hypothetical protein